MGKLKLSYYIRFKNYYPRYVSSSGVWWTSFQPSLNNDHKIQEWKF